MEVDLQSHASSEFRKRLRRLPPEVQRIARSEYEKFRANPFNPSLEFKRVKGQKQSTNFYSIRAGQYQGTHYRALGAWTKRTGDVVWFWIGTHEEYNNLIKRL